MTVPPVCLGCLGLSRGHCPGLPQRCESHRSHVGKKICSTPWETLDQTCRPPDQDINGLVLFYIVQLLSLLTGKSQTTSAGTTTPGFSSPETRIKVSIRQRTPALSEATFDMDVMSIQIDEYSEIEGKLLCDIPLLSAWLLLTAHRVTSAAHRVTITSDIYQHSVRSLQVSATYVGKFSTNILLHRVK